MGDSKPVDQTDRISVRGARVHNLRDIDVDLPRDRLVAITGVSGSGKSSLAFDTLHAEGRRRYLDSVANRNRQFLHQLERPDVDQISGLPPTISVDQKPGPVNPRSTLATTTELHDFLRILFARAGRAHCPQCGRDVAQQSVASVVDQVTRFEDGQKVVILAPLVIGRKGQHRELFRRIVADGFLRARVNGEIVDASTPPELAAGRKHDIDAVIDRIVVRPGLETRLEESIRLALKHGAGSCVVSQLSDQGSSDRMYSTRFACPACELSFPDLQPRSFSFNSPHGACPDCEGLGGLLDSTAGNTAEPRPDDLAKAVCPACQGSRLNPFSRRVELHGLTIPDFLALTVGSAHDFISELEQSLDDGSLRDDARRLIYGRVLPDIGSRLGFLRRVGLDYLSLDRATTTLSGGELQRARLAGCLGSGLLGACYILDEPTVGLHPSDTRRLIEVLRSLCDRGNSVLVVEHDTDVIRAADWIVDVGPGSGPDGGCIVSDDTPAAVISDPASVTGKYLSGAVEQPTVRRGVSLSAESVSWLTLSGARRHNLRNIDLRIPLGALTCVCGVSGSGKSTAVMHCLVPAVQAQLAGAAPLDSGRLEGGRELERVVSVDQSPIGRSARSNAATYSGIWDEIRKVFSQTREARVRGFTPRRFSFNARDGRCSECSGQGVQKIEMHFMPDEFVTCAVCHGRRFNPATLAVRYRQQTVADVLSMRCDEAADFFESFPRLQSMLQTFVDVGLGYLTLGQSSLTLSGGEAQRVKLASELGRRSHKQTLYVLDEPTSGLHPADVRVLIGVLDRLVNQQHTVVVIEHNLDLIASADWIVDLGPGGGAAGGGIVASGIPADVRNIAESPTGCALAAH